MNQQLETKTSREDDKLLYVESQYEGICTTCRKYGHKGKECWHKEGENILNCHYYDKPGRLNKDRRKRIRQEKANNSKNKDKKRKFNYCKMNNHEEKDFYRKKKAEK